MKKTPKPISYVGGPYGTVFKPEISPLSQELQDAIVSLKSEEVDLLEKLAIRYGISSDLFHTMAGVAPYWKINEDDEVSKISNDLHMELAMRLKEVNGLLNNVLEPNKSIFFNRPFYSVERENVVRIIYLLTCVTPRYGFEQENRSRVRVFWDNLKNKWIEWKNKKQPINEYEEDKDD